MTRCSKRLWSFAAASAAVVASSSPSSSSTATAAALMPSSGSSSASAVTSLTTSTRMMIRRQRSHRIRLPTNKALDASSSSDAMDATSTNSAATVTTTTTTTPSFTRKRKTAATVSPSLSSATESRRTKGIASATTTTRPKKIQSVLNVVPRTQSFAAAVDDTQPHHVGPHTLILGTHPGIQSLALQQYYGHPLNAFWWIAGDCLGFRRGTATSPVTGKPYQLAADLRHPATSSSTSTSSSMILPYPEQLDTLLRSGFCLWDVVASCERPGSLDQDIRQAEPNDIFAFCQAHPTIRRIVLANGGTGSKEFIRHFTDWLATGQLVVCSSDSTTAKAFGPILKRLQNQPPKTNSMAWTSPHTISLVAAISVSPAAARFSYAVKRDFWDRHVYQPGLELLREQQQQQQQQRTSKYFGNQQDERTNQ